MKAKQIRLVATIAMIMIIGASCRSTKKFQPTVSDIAHPKREFRGAWMHTVYQAQYAKMNPEEMKIYFIQSLNYMKQVGINAVVFQVRPQADAFYKSKYEPWSSHLTGTQGIAPANDFDPLAFITAEAHKRNIELHAWLNPYRVTVSANQKLASSHLYHKEPERFVEYGDKIYFDPGLPQNRDFICKVVQDIILNYEVDAIHMDDYFYPYPVAVKSFPDDDSYAKYGSKFSKRDDWRRNNVNLLIKEIKETITTNKPWVRFGVSPFGIYRNKRTIEGGSDTNGLQNYDDLYADVKLWVKEGWIDYNLPQLYWEIGHKSADYTTLINWWNENNYGKHLYIGQDVKRSMDAKNSAGLSQIEEKIILSRTLENVHGNCFWPVYLILENYENIAKRLYDSHHQYPALIPAYTHMYKKAPKQVSKLRTESQRDGIYTISWESNHEANKPESAQYYVVYRFKKGVKKNLNNAMYIVELTKTTYHVLERESGSNEYEYVITAVDGFHNESKGKSIKISL